MTRLVVIGGSDAGVSAGLRARELDADIEVKLILADRYPNFSICGLPFFISGETPEWRSLAHRPAAELEAAGLDLMLEVTAERIDSAANSVHVVGADGSRAALEYDKLVVATGALSIRPPIAGIDSPGVHVLHSMADSFAVHQAVAEGARSALIVGGGYLGLEMADAFRHLGLEVSVVEMADQVMTTVDRELARPIADELRSHGVDLVLETTIEGIQRIDGRLSVTGSGGFEAQADLVLVVVGVRPNSKLAGEAGIELGVRGAIKVNYRMETSAPNIYAAGDCVVTQHRMIPEPIYLPLGTTAHKQGRIAGENAAGGSAEFAGSLGTQVVKVFDLAVARTGFRDAEAAAAGFEPLSVDVQVADHKAYYPGAKQLSIRLTGDRRSGRLIGAQIVGDHRAQVSKRIDILAAALYSELSVAALMELDLSYTPPFSSPWDPVQAAAAAWLDATRH